MGLELLLSDRRQVQMTTVKNQKAVNANKNYGASALRKAA